MRGMQSEIIRVYEMVERLDLEMFQYRLDVKVKKGGSLKSSSVAVFFFLFEFLCLELEMIVFFVRYGFNFINIEFNCQKFEKNLQGVGGVFLFVF